MNPNAHDPDDRMETASEADDRMETASEDEDDDGPLSKRQKVWTCDEMEDAGAAQADAGADAGAHAGFVYVVPDQFDAGQAQANKDRRTAYAAYRRGQLWIFFQKSFRKWKLVENNGKANLIEVALTEEELTTATQPTRAEFEVFFAMLTATRKAERQPAIDAFEPIRSGLFCHKCDKQSDSILMCGAPLVRGNRVNTWAFEGIPAAKPALGTQCPQKTLDKKVRRARVFADEHGENQWRLRACFVVFKQSLADIKSVRQILSERHEDPAVYARLDEIGRLNTLVQLPARMWAPHDGNADAKLTRGTLAYCALKNLCANFICEGCSKAHGMKNNLSNDPEQEAFCFDCYMRETCRPHHTALKARMDAIRAWAYLRRRPQRDVAFEPPPRASTLVLGRNTRDLWMGSDSAGDHGLIRKPPTKGNQYSYSEINALLSAVPHPFQQHSMEAHEKWTLVRDFTRRHELTQAEFRHHFGEAALKLLLRTMTVLPRSGKFVMKGEEYEEAPRGESDDSDEGGCNLPPESDADDGDAEDSDSEASDSDDSDSDSDSDSDRAGD